MFSSDPFAIAGAKAARQPVSPIAWVPDDIPIVPESFDGLDDFGGDEIPTPAAAVRPDVEAAVRAALAAREIEEAALREQLQAEAYAAGLAAGRQQAEAAMRQALASAIEALWLATEEVRTSEAHWLGALEDNLVALAVAAAHHVIGREIATDDTFVRQLAATAIAEFPQDHAIHLRVNPQDLATLREMFEDAAARAGDIRWTADPRIERGGCVIEGRDRIVDGRVDTALERIYRSLSGHHA